MPDSSPPSRFPWRAYFQRAVAPVFVVGASRRLRYANPAWEVVTGAELARLRGMRVSARRSASPLGQALTPPLEVWAGWPTTVRRAVPPADAGPPWWDITFVPILGPEKPLGVLGFIRIVGETASRSEARKVPASLAALRAQHAAAYSFDLFEGPSALAERLVRQIRLAATTAVPVWLVGESGTGKETLARVIHHSSPKRERAFLTVECGQVPPYLIAGQLFGNSGLIDTGHLGTLYLREPAALPRDLQTRIAGLAERVRVVCGSSAVAADEVRAERLVPAFHTELSVLEVRLPALRDRPDDLPKLVERLLHRRDEPVPRLADEVWPVLRAHDWPGNIRELASVLDQAVGRAGGEPVTASHLPRYVRTKHLLASDPVVPTTKWTLDGILEAVERRLIEQALRQAGNSQTDAAARLGVFRSRLFRRMEVLGIPTPPQPAKSRRKPEPTDPPG